ncbi:MAG TPA: aldolase/citrate lyase family protein [Candidatus Sumerlaeota bacterium]|nr:aldolase/citrate lyase family protein [Candidatus Sumerlaeota bacterium]HOR27360.1 aldolase/citrate lyase family protein [Candidatus Sumerlaeota bacterium]
MKTFRQALAEKKFLLGTFLQIPAADSAEIAGHAGMDFGIVDTEHGTFGADSAIDLVRGCDTAGMASVFRVPRLDHHRIGQALDFGASAVMVPNLTSRAQAEQVIKAAKFHPLGQRGVCPFTRCGGFNAADEDPDFYSRANRDTCVILQIEGVEGISNLDQILEVDHLDGIFIGPFDLSQSLGIPGKVTDDRVLEAIRGIVQRADARSVAVGNFAVTLDQARAYRDIGVRFVAYGVDTLMLHRAYRDLRRALLAEVAAVEAGA